MGTHFVNTISWSNGHQVRPMERHHPQKWPNFGKYILKNHKKWVENGTFATKVYTFS